MKVRHEHWGDDAVRMYGVHDCQKATTLNQIWLLVEPDIVLPRSDGSREHTLYIVCGLCGRFRTDV